MTKHRKEKIYPLNHIYFYLTGGCNLCCRHCWIDPIFQSPGRSYPVLDTDLFASIVRQAKSLGLSGVKFTGGEPLLHPDIRDLVKMVRFEGLHLTVETNGVLCTPEMAKELAEAGDAFVAVSLDGSDAATHEWLRGVEGCFESSINGIRNLVSAGLKPQLIMSVMRRNREQIEPVVRLAEQLGAGSVKFNIVEPTARGERMHEEGETMSVKELIELGQWVERTLSDSTELRLVYDYPAAFHPLGRMLGGNGDGCCVCGILRIMGVLADGSYALCGIGEIVPELVLGHAAVDRLEDVWNKASLLQELREGLPGRLEGVCRECFMKGVCLGSCIAQNYYRCRNLWAPFWFCDEAEREGLFPETRRYRPDMLVQRHTLI